MTLAKARLRSALAAACVLALPGGALAPSPLAAQEGASAVQDVTLADVALPLGGALYRAPKLTASGTRLSRDDLAAILKPDSSEPWPARLARLDAGSITIPVLTSESPEPGEVRQTGIYRDVVARDVRAGRIGELTAAGATLSTAGGPAPASGTYGRIRATDLDLPALSRLWEVPGDGKGPVLRVYGTFEIADVTLSGPRGVTISVAQVSGRDFGGRQIPGGWRRATDAVTAGPAGPEGRRAFATAVADLIEARAPSSFELRGLNTSVADPHGSVLIKLGRVAYAGPGPDAGLVLEDLSLSSEAVRARLGRLTLAEPPLERTAAAFRALATEAGPDAGFSQAELRRLVSVPGALGLRDLTVDLPPEAATPPRKPTPGAKAADGGTVAAKPADAPGDPLFAAPAPPRRITLREATLAFGTQLGGAPNGMRLDLSGLSLPSSFVAGAPMLGALAGYGYRDLDLDATVALDTDEGTRDLVLRDLAVSGRDIGKIRLAGTLGGLGDLLSGGSPDAAALMATASARTLDLTVENAGLFDRFLTTQARDLSLKPDELRKEYVTASLLGVPMILGNTPAARAIGAALGAFVMKPGTLVLHARAKEPGGVPLMDLGAARSPAAVLDRFDVDAKAN